MRGNSSSDFTVPNFCTVLRVLMAATAAYMLANDQKTALAAFLLISASALDYFDGWYARRFNQTTSLGAHLDPFADKVLTGVIFVSLSRRLGWTWFSLFTGVMLLREAAITIHRMVVKRVSGRFIPSNRFGKIKTAGQSVLGDAILFYVYIHPRVLPESERPIFWAMLAVTIVTVDSGLRYLLPSCQDGKKRSLMERLVIWAYGITARGA